ncbi:SDR family NAD(P)-dependent oxidoreductase [Enteractinococcus helveticum]|uniref:SDR family NAD(P)-dependent oxidoreductase n=1 Tax=Enteractinococcus helveticum TaxID=1837282 RepID=UPI000AEE0304|nr:SDR family oxidoreductase [Enteractinococcus helveticum]
MTKTHDHDTGQPRAIAQRLSGTCAIVTGAAQGIGRAIADRLAAEGSIVVCLDIQEMAAPVVQGQEFHFCDVTDAHQVQDVVAKVLDEHGGVDILVNNAGLLEQARSLRDVTSEQLHKYFDTNAVGPMLMVQAAYDALIASKWRGRVINIASRTFFTGSSRQPAYVASKGALLGLTRVMAHELGQYGVTVNAVLPSQIASPGTRRYTSDESFASTMSRQAIREFVSGDDVAGTVAFLASPDGTMMTGQTVVCDGGGLMR